MSQTEAPAAEQKPAALFPLGRFVTLSSGNKLEIRKWSLETMSRVLQLAPKAVDRFTDLLQQNAAKDSSLSAYVLVPHILPDVKIIVAETLGWDVARVDRELSVAEDFLEVVTAIWDHCLMGLLVKILGLTMRFGTLARQPGSASASEK